MRDKLIPEERLRILGTFPGYGKIETARILFVGIEEGGTWSEDEAKVDFELRNMENQTWNADRKPSPTEMWQVRLSTRLQGMRLDAGQLMDYYRDQFCRGVEFTSNLFPMACRGTNDWPEHYGRLFGVSRDKKEFMTACLDLRMRITGDLVSRIGAKDGSCIILFGKALWVHASDLFQDGRPMAPVHGHPQLMRDAAGRRWCTYHPSWHWWTQDDENYLVREFPRA